jgi:hypothetical protein
MINGQPWQTLIPVIESSEAVLYIYLYIYIYSFLDINIFDN